MLSCTDIRFSDQEREIIELIVNDALSNKEIGEALGICEQAIKNKVRAIYGRAGLKGAGEHKRIALWRMMRVPVEKSSTRARLSNREWLIAQMVSEGASNSDIARHFGIGVSTMKNYIKNLFNKTGVWSRLELAAWVDAHRKDSMAEAHAG